MLSWPSTLSSPPVSTTTVLVCAHNEEEYIRECLQGVLEQTRQPLRIILIADQCSDKTAQLSFEVLPRDSLIIRKEKASWKNSYAENLEIGRKKATGEFLAIIDADIRVPPSFLERLAQNPNDFASVSALVKTDPRKGWLNKLVSYWEKTYLFTPLGREPRGGARTISLEALEKVGGFHDVMAPDSDLDIRLRQASMKVSIDRSVVALHLRRMTIRRSIRFQIYSGQKRRELGVSFLRTFLHSIGRFRPFVLYGYLRASKDGAGG